MFKHSLSIRHTLLTRFSLASGGTTVAFCTLQQCCYVEIIMNNEIHKLVAVTLQK